MSEKSQAFAAKLKNEGNVLFTKKQYANAYTKYSEAIVQDEQNAVLFANRAACSLHLGKYLDASMDSHKAVSLDPSYSKAWARLAKAEAALGEYEESAKHWEKALSTLPTENLTPAELRQKQEFTAELKIMREKVKALKQGETAASLSGITPDQAPFHRALAMESELRSRSTEKQGSSAWVLLEAYKDFSNGINNMKTLKQQASGPTTFTVGHLGALTDITNGILRDYRVFHIEDPNFLDMYNKQVIFEAQKWGALTEGGSEHITSEMLKLQQSDGWNVVRPALSTTIRAYFMRGFLEGRLKRNHEAEYEFLERVLEILHWGNTGPWKSVSTTDKGVIFEKTFIRGIRVLHMEACMNVYVKDPGPNSASLIKKMSAEAKGVLRELESAEEEIAGKTLDPGFVSSVYIYPRAYAHAMIGFCNLQMVSLVERTVEAIEPRLRQAAKSYLQAADHFPIDDENHVWFLNSAITSLWRCGTPIRDTLPIMERIRLAIPEMKKIWEHSAMSQSGRDQALQRVLWAEEDVLEGLASGKYKMDDKIMPDYLLKR